MPTIQSVVVHDWEPLDDIHALVVDIAGCRHGHTRQVNKRIMQPNMTLGRFNSAGKLGSRYIYKGKYNQADTMRREDRRRIILDVQCYP